ncbi:ABC transporter ATP-binding protein [Brachybacterium huguangmaarense]
MGTVGDVEPRAGIGRDFALLRRIFTQLPWKMGPRIAFLLVAGLLAAALDTVAVLAMLPLTQMLTSADGSVPSVLQAYLVPLLGTDERAPVLLALALFVGTAFLVKNIAMIVIRWWSIGITARASAALQARVLRRYVYADYSSHRRRSKAVILQTVTNSAAVSIDLVLLGYITLAVDLLTVILLFGTLFVLSPVACALALIVFGGGALILSRVLKPWAMRYATKGMELATDSWRSVNPAIEGFRESRVFRREGHFVGAYEANRAQSAAVSQRERLLGELPKYLLEIIMIAGIFSVALVLFAMQPEATAFALLAAFGAASMRVIPALNRLVATFNGVRVGRPHVELVAEQLRELDAAAARDRSTHEVIAPVPVADIVVADARFRYPDADEDVLSDVSVTIRRGATVALVGASGAGKSTFADILAGLLTATGGSVTVGGYDIAEHPRSWLANVAMVSQKVYLWEATVRDLITFGVPVEEVDEALLEDVVDRARLRSFVDGLPEGLDTVIGDSGARVSGGQAQRLGIARALYAQPNVLILDEATSALDNETEFEITETIEALRGSITVIVIAHRLSTVKNADEILFFSKGRLQSRGTMAQLTASDPEFARLVELGSLEAPVVSATAPSTDGDAS